jgi:hypothetical protein
VTPPSDDILPTYLRLRETQRELNRALVKTLSKKAIEESARRLHLLERGTIAAEDESAMDLVMDTAIYDYYPSGGKNAVGRFAAQRRVEGDEAIVLEAMCRAEFTLIELADPVEGVGMRAHDLIADEHFLLADVALSHAGAPGVVLATRILRFDSFGMTTGAHLVFDPELASLVTPSLHVFAGRHKRPSPQRSSALAGLFIKLGMMDPEDARIMLADFAVASLPRDDPRRATYARLRAERLVDQ